MTTQHTSPFMLALAIACVLGAGALAVYERDRFAAPEIAPEVRNVAEAYLNKNLPAAFTHFQLGSGVRTATLICGMTVADSAPAWEGLGHEAVRERRYFKPIIGLEADKAGGKWSIARTSLTLTDDPNLLTDTVQACLTMFRDIRESTRTAAIAAAKQAQTNQAAWAASAAQ